MSSISEKGVKGVRGEPGGGGKGEGGGGTCHSSSEPGSDMFYTTERTLLVLELITVAPGHDMLMSGTAIFSSSPTLSNISDMMMLVFSTKSNRLDPLAT